MSRSRSRPRFPNIDHYQQYDAFLTVGGTKDKNVLRDPSSDILYIAKLGRRNNDLEVMTEYAIFLVGRSLGLTLAQGRVARYRGRLRFLSQYFLNRESAEELVHGVQLFKELYDDSTVGNALHQPASEQALFTVQAIRAAFGAHYYEYGTIVEEELFSGFVAMLAHDALIGVQDRHHENWGVIVQRGKGSPAPRFAPLYDSARGMFCTFTDDVLADRFLRDEEGDRYLADYVVKSRPWIGFDGLIGTNTKRKLVSHHDLLGAVYKEYPRQRPVVRRVIDAFDPDLVRDELRRHVYPLCDARREMLIVRCLTARRDKLQRAINC